MEDQEEKQLLYAMSGKLDALMGSVSEMKGQLSAQIGETTSIKVKLAEIEGRLGQGAQRMNQIEKDCAERDTEAEKADAALKGSIEKLDTVFHADMQAFKGDVKEELAGKLSKAELRAYLLGASLGGAVGGGSLVAGLLKLLG